MCRLKVCSNICSIVFALLLANNIGFGQTPFLCKDQAFGILNGTTDEFVELVVAPFNSAINVSPINTLDENINAIGYRKIDNLIYGIGPVNHNLYRIDATGDVITLTTLDLQSSMTFLAGDIDPTGQFLYAIGSLNGVDQSIVKINLESGLFNVQSVPLGGITYISDIAFDPFTNVLYGYDTNSKRIITINTNNGNIDFLEELPIDKDIQSVYFDSYGDLWAYGSTIYGVASALFKVDKLTGLTTVKSTGPPNNIWDGTSCPYSVEMKNEVEPLITFPCSEVEYTFTITNNTGVVHSGIDFEHFLPEGCTYLNILQNPFGGIVEPGTPSDLMKINDLTIPKGIDSIVFLVEVGDIPGGDYSSQATLKNLPENLGGFRLSDNPESAIALDSTTLEVNRIEEDSLFFTRFLCLGESVLLDGSPYGNNLLWNTGSTNQNLFVTHEGNYTLEAVSGCQTVVVSFHVTVASCPYTIAVYHEIVPQEALACNDLLYRFIISNDSGLRRDSVSFLDILQNGFSFVDFVKNPFGGSLEPNLPDNEVIMHNLSLPIGVDTLEFLVEVGDIPPGEYKNRAKIYNLPSPIGMLRFSNDLNNVNTDSTIVKILGVEDSLWLEEVICANEALVLDGSPYGLNFLWENGSTADSIFVNDPGEYLLTLTGGCEPGFIFFNVVEGDPIDVEIPESQVEIHLGDEIKLSPLLYNGGDSLFLEWNDPLENSLSCQYCLEPYAGPLNNATYEISVSNGVCSDKDSVLIVVDKERKIYVPNAFTPNFDGVNDYFYIQSPDYGMIKSLVIFDRWGVPVFEIKDVPVNEYPNGWNGQFKNKDSNIGVYLWQAEIEFLDGLSQQFSGDVTLLR